MRCCCRCCFLHTINEILLSEQLALLFTAWFSFHTKTVVYRCLCIKHALDLFFVVVGFVSLIYFCRSGRIASTAKEPQRATTHSSACCAGPPALLVLQALQEALHRPGRASSGRTPLEVRRKGSGGTGEERRQAQGCVGGSPRFGLGMDLRTSRVCVRVYGGLPVEDRTQLICIWSAPGV